MSGHAVVVGGGIAGLAAAVALRRRSWRVTVLERRPELSEVGAGITLWPNALRALDELGAGARIRALGLAQTSGGIRDDRGKWLSRTDTEAMAARFGDGLVVLERRQLLDTLRDACTGVDIRLSTDVAGVGADGTVAISPGESIRGDVVIGADGLRSAVRAALWPAAKVRSTGMLAARLIGRVPDPDGVRGGESWGRGDYAGVAPLPDGRLYAYLVVPVTAGAPDEPGEALRWWRQRFASWHFPLPQLLAGVEPDQLLRNELFDLAPLSGLASGRVALVGDAAHAMTPNLGQGACQALEDAVELGACLASGATDIERHLETYSARRLPRVHRLAARSRTAGRVAALHGRVPATIRNTLVSLVPAARALRALDPVVGWRPPAG
ncbi:FAD-dependent oxidoreductase [Amycolatopsis alkalitolerans]|uniref:FAD-dependent oxidoreductase n=1 Tax=Amycolatopsis alkalitolerans TaxID=2547244 RepID=A0A5C4LSI1_9PSEU|nr:FAD-dependent oxidoreductase [Amycolatopsis alkalitolerans]TNC21526.1 FAD-dependent oxidoreductase [Amycolatopsis alkalitolerans]